MCVPSVLTLHSPHSHEVVVEGVVVALVGGAAGLVAPVLAVVDQEGGALVHQGVDTHLRVDVQLKYVDTIIHPRDDQTIDK